MLKVKTMILGLIIILELIVFVRYTFRINDEGVYDFFLIVSGFVQSIILFMICYFYTKKAAHFLDDNKKIRQMMRKAMLIVVIVFVCLAVYQFWDKRVIDKNIKSLCHTVYFILPASVNQLANCFFFYVGCKVNKTINELNA